MNDNVSYPRKKIKILLLEGIHQAAEEKFRESGYEVELRKDSPRKEELAELIARTHILGIRSKTKIDREMLEKAESLLCVGCFCIGTDQVDLDFASKRGIPVFNAPFSNTRSVAELSIAEIIMLARKACYKSNLLHQGIWEKSAEGCVEVRGKTLGIVGYGHIGPQVGILAEAFGMRVLYFDIATKLPLGNAQAVRSLDEILYHSDFVTLHVPETERTVNLIGKKELALMKKNSCLINLSRGNVVELDALADSLKTGHLAGAALDVFPKEPNSNQEKFDTPLQGIPNVILTPHIGGSTIEAQKNIGLEVAHSMLKYIEAGSTFSAVNFPQVELPISAGCHRILNIHKNVPGVISNINTIVAEIGVNIQAQVVNTHGDMGYLVMDVSQDLSREAKEKIAKLGTSIKTRLVY